MKKVVNIAYSVVLMGVIIAKISNWVFSYSETTNEIINTIMFCLIGVGYIYWAITQTHRLYQILVLLCGMFVILMNFIEKSSYLTIIGIVCLIIPMVLFRLEGKKEEQEV